MRFEARTFWLPKDADETAQYQDAFELDSELGRAAIADGVSSAIFSGPWARLLTLATVAGPPPLDDPTAFQDWLAEKRAAWLASVDTTRLTWYQRPKMVDGAMTTLLWLELLPTETNEQGLATRYQLRTFAIGDSCLFHLRDGDWLYWFPLESAAEFGLNPAVVGSVDRKLDHLLEFKARETECLPGDLLVLATDAIALWAIEARESGEAVDWPRYWDYSDEDWRSEIFSLRDAKRMRFDDSTLVLLRVIEEQPAPAVEPAELIGPDAVTADEDLPLSEGDVADELSEAENCLSAEPVDSEIATDVPVASLTKVIESADHLRFDAAVEEAVEVLEGEIPAGEDEQVNPVADDTGTAGECHDEAENHVDDA